MHVPVNGSKHNAPQRCVSIRESIEKIVTCMSQRISKKPYVRFRCFSNLSKYGSMALLPFSGPVMGRR